MIDDIFCKIISQRSSENVVMEGEDWLAIKDIHPVAPVHVLIMPKKHLAHLGEAGEGEKAILGELLLAANKVARKLGLENQGFRLIINSGPSAGQLVPHLHLHLVGGKKLGPKIIQT